MAPQKGSWMQIKIFMSSGADLYEHDLLRSFGLGVETWLKENAPDHSAQRQLIASGRWTQLSASQCSHGLEYEYTESYRACDVAVIFGSWKPREKGTHHTRNSVAAQASRFVVIETPLLKRSTGRENQYWRVGINGYLNRDAVWPTLKPREAEQRLDDLGIKWNGWCNNSDGHVVVVLQLPGDASLRGTDINEWAYRTVTEIRSQVDRPIVIRTHPLVSDRAFELHAQLGFRLMKQGVKDVRFSDGAVTPWSQDIEDAYCTVTFTSGMAVDSVLAGIPTIACDIGNFAWGISSNHVDEITNVMKAPTKEVRHWLSQMAACQWSAKEMRSGQVWQYLLRSFAEMDGTA
jgi:hypothetical protein